jgi:hypothetical protein
MNKLRRFAPSLGLIPLGCYALGHAFPQLFWGTILPYTLALAGIVLIVSAIRHRNRAEVNSFLRSALGMFLLGFGFVLYAGWHPELGAPLSLPTPVLHMVYFQLYPLANLTLFILAFKYRRKP